MRFALHAIFIMAIIMVVWWLYVVAAHGHGMPALPPGSPYGQRGPGLTTMPPNPYTRPYGRPWPRNTAITPMRDPWGVPYRYQPRRPYGTR